jgi:hypothetical protein
MKLTTEEKELLADWQDAAELTVVDEQDLFMDNHGCNVVLVVCRDPEDQLVGFTYRYSSEERFYDDDPMETIPVVARQVQSFEYDRADGDDWNEHV